MYRFVILHHQQAADEHWDIMLETESTVLTNLLTTWSIPPQLPTDGSAQGLTFRCGATRLPDHRKHYLDYEGDVSGNRGTVRHVDSGTYKQTAPDTFILDGTIFKGTLLLRQNDKTNTTDENPSDVQYQREYWCEFVAE